MALRIELEDPWKIIVQDSLGYLHVLPKENVDTCIVLVAPKSVLSTRIASVPERYHYHNPAVRPKREKRRRMA